MTSNSGRVHWLWWPIYALWRLVAAIIELTGRFVAILLGVALMFAGAVLCLTIVGAIIGVPLILFGLMLTLRGIF